MPQNFKQKSLCRVRTITSFISLGLDQSLWQGQIEKATDLCAQLTVNIQKAGYIVQTNRIVTNPFGDYLNTSSLQTAREGLSVLNRLIQGLDAGDIRIRFAIGEASTVNEIALVPELVKEFGDLCNICVNVGLDDNGILNNNLIIKSAEAVKKISEITPRGEGNFNFTVNFNCDPLIPYFPASYHKEALGDCFVIGLETPDLLIQVLSDANDNVSKSANKSASKGASKNATKEPYEHDHNRRFNHYYQVMSEALGHHICAINDIVLASHLNHEFTFSGFDSSAAPSKDCGSMAQVYEHMGVAHFGASGTVEASALLTKVFKSVEGVELVGFSGLMLALTEDIGLAAGTVKLDYDIRALLTYSAVCGIGLDTVPIPGDTCVDKIAALMRDTGTMAFRLKKPLTVRLFPVPGLKAGDVSAFESDDLCNCAVLAVP